MVYKFLHEISVAELDEVYHQKKDNRQIKRVYIEPKLPLWRWCFTESGPRLLTTWNDKTFNYYWSHRTWAYINWMQKGISGLRWKVLISLSINWTIQHHLRVLSFLALFVSFTYRIQFAAYLLYVIQRDEHVKFHSGPENKTFIIDFALCSKHTVLKCVVSESFWFNVMW